MVAFPSRMRTLLLLLLCATIALAGCAGEAPAADAVPASPSAAVPSAIVPVPSPTPATAAPPVETCPSPALKAAAYAAAEAFFTDLGGKRLTMQMEGTMEGVVGTITFAIDPQAKRMLVDDSNEGRYVFVGEQYSVKADGTTVVGRDFNPKGAFWNYYQLIMGDMRADQTTGFAADLTVGDYEAECVTLGGVEAIRYTSESGDMRDVFTLERAAPHRPLSGTVVDPALKDNYRVKLAYGEPTISLDASGTRAAPTITFEIVDKRTNAQGGVYMSVRIAEDTHYARFSDLDVRLVGEDGTVYREDDLEHADYDFDDGDNFQYRDRDGDEMVSPGDTFVMDVGPGLDIFFYDVWSKQYATMAGKE